MTLSFYGLLASSAWFTSVLGTPSVDIVYCASINTATTSSNSSIYQSDGLCHDMCYDDYAYAVVSGTECWCSDYTPSKSDQVDTDKCDDPCAGYPSDWCGGDGVYAYMSLAKSPSGTAGASSAAATSASSASASAAASSSHTSSSSSTKTTTTSSSTSTHPTTTSTSSTFSISTTSSSTSSTSSTSTSSSSTSRTSISSTLSTSISKTTTTSTPVTVQTVTAAGGIVQTVTVTPSAATATAAPTSHKGLSTGAAVGIAVGVVAAVVLGGIAVFVLWRRKRRERDAIYAEHNSKATSPRGATPNASSPKVSEVSAADQSGRRRSALMPIDPRIDPAFSGIYSRTGENKSRDSVNSLRDDHDYSRRVHQPNGVLRAMNPDPENE